MQCFFPFCACCSRPEKPGSVWLLSSRSSILVSSLAKSDPAKHARLVATNSSTVMRDRLPCRIFADGLTLRAQEPNSPVFEFNDCSGAHHNRLAIDHGDPVARSRWQAFYGVKVIQLKRKRL